MANIKFSINRSQQRTVIPAQAVTSGDSPRRESSFFNSIDDAGSMSGMTNEIINEK